MYLILSNLITIPLLRQKMCARSQILTEFQNGRYRIVDRKPAIISALGAIPKKDSNNVRLIHDASRPSGQALNDYAINDHFQYQSIQDAVDLITPNC